MWAGFLALSLIPLRLRNSFLRPHQHMRLQKYVYKGAGSVTDLVIHLTNAKHLIFNILHAVIPPLDGQTCPKARKSLPIDLRNKPANMWLSKYGRGTYNHADSVHQLDIQLYTMPTHYCSTYMMPYPHLMAKHCLR